jgi:uncharacterized protein YbaP (TraB family)
VCEEGAKRSRNAACSKGITMNIARILGCHGRPAGRIFACFLIALLASGTFWSRTSHASERKKHFLWSLESKKNTVFILGSLHVFQQADYPLAPEIEAAYSEAREVVFETDIDKTKDPAFQAEMMGLGLYMNGQTLSDNVSPKTYKILEEKIVATGLPMAAFEHFKPWFAALALSVMELKRLGFDSRYGIDTYFHEKAVIDGKAISALETPEYQLQLFKALNMKEEEAFLRQALEELDLAGAMFSDMAEAWMTGNVGKLDAIVRESFKDFQEIYQLFVVQRNRNWVEVVDRLTRYDKNVLVIVGAAHLVGRDSVLRLLEAKGHKIEQR